MNAGRLLLGLNKDFHYHYEWKNYARCPNADYIIVDEIQDFTKSEITEFIDSAQKCVYFFGDPAQSIYGQMKEEEPFPMERLQEDFIKLRNNTKRFVLYKNYRLPVPVAKFAHCVGFDMAPFYETTYQSKINVPPRMIRYRSAAEQIEAIHRIIKNRNLEDVGILLPTNDYVKEVYSKLLYLGGDYEVKYNDRENNNYEESLNFMSSNPKIMTYHSAKGLQFETVFMPYIEKFSDDGASWRRALYVAMTRTYSNLYLLYSNFLPEPLASIDNSLYIETETDRIEDK